ncbi:ferredoxin [Mycolicibacterium sp. HS_4_1]
MASGICQRSAPQVFGSTRDGWVVLLAEQPSPELQAAVIRAAESCPVGAIETIELSDEDPRGLR